MRAATRPVHRGADDRISSRAEGSVSVLTAGVMVLACVLSLVAADITVALSTRARGDSRAC